MFLTSTLTVGVVHRHGGMDVVRRGHTVCHRRRKHLSVRTILDLQIIPMMGQPVVKEDRLRVTILFLQMMICIIKMVRSVAKKTVRYDNCLHLIRIIWIVKLVAKSVIQYGNLFAKYLDYFDSLAPPKRNIHPLLQITFIRYGSYE